jgi:hypothetical protein
MLACSGVRRVLGHAPVLTTTRRCTLMAPHSARSPRR